MNPLKTISLKLDPKQLRMLLKLSQETHVPKSSLIRQGIDLVLRKAGEDVISSELRREVDAVLTEDRGLLKKLAKA